MCLAAVLYWVSALNVFYMASQYLFRLDIWGNNIRPPPARTRLLHGTYLILSSPKQFLAAFLYWVSAVYVCYGEPKYVF